MISFSLSCDNDHEFDGWFRSNDDFEAQKKRGLVSCPVCHSTRIDKALMAPAVASGRDSGKVALAMGEDQRKAMVRLKQMVERMRAEADYVGDKFAEEARKIHFGEVQARGIYGEATLDEARNLAEEGVEFMPLPTFPDDKN